MSGCEGGSLLRTGPEQTKGFRRVYVYVVVVIHAPKLSAVVQNVISAHTQLSTHQD